MAKTTRPPLPIYPSRRPLEGRYGAAVGSYAITLTELKAPRLRQVYS